VSRGIALFFLGPQHSRWGGVSPTHRPPLLPGKIQYLLYRRLAKPQGRSGRAESLVPTGIRSQTVQAVVCRYTDWAIRPKQVNVSYNSICGESWVTWDFMKIRVCVTVPYVCNKVGLQSRAAKCRWNLAGYAEFQTRISSHWRVKSYTVLTWEACVCRTRMSLQFCWKFRKTSYPLQNRSDDFTKHITR